MICQTADFSFHHDMWQRPLFIVTPKVHYENLEECPPDLLRRMFHAIQEFMHFWHLPSYQLQVNVGDWKTHSHLHVKIRAPELAVTRMRRDHFERVARERTHWQGAASGPFWLACQDIPPPLETP